jgi:hypothetical protein
VGKVLFAIAEAGVGARVALLESVLLSGANVGAVSLSEGTTAVAVVGGEKLNVGAEGPIVGDASLVGFDEGCVVGGKAIVGLGVGPLDCGDGFVVIDGLSVGNVTTVAIVGCDDLLVGSEGLVVGGERTAAVLIGEAVD